GEAFFDGIEALPQRVVFGIRHAWRVVLIVAPVVSLKLQRQSHMLDLGLRLAELFDVGESFGFCCFGHNTRYGSSFRDCPKDQTRNLEIPGSMLRIAPE